MNNENSNTQNQMANNSTSADLWNRLNDAYNAKASGDFQADLYWPTKDRKQEEGDLEVEIVGGKLHMESEPPRLHFHLRIPSLNKTGIKSCRLAPESMRFLRMDMERLGIRVTDIRKLSTEMKGLLHRRIQARLYFNENTKWQDLDFMGFIADPVKHDDSGFVECEPEDSDDFQGSTLQ